MSAQSYCTHKHIFRSSVDLCVKFIVVLIVWQTYHCSVSVDAHCVHFVIKWPVQHVITSGLLLCQSSLWWSYTCIFETVTFHQLHEFANVLAMSKLLWGILDWVVDQTQVRAVALCRLRGCKNRDLLCFLAGCHTRRLNQALSVLSLSLDFFECVCCAVN